MPKPEARARQNIDAALEAAGWVVQDFRAVNLRAARGVAVREFKMANNFDEADYLLFVDGKAAGAVEAKKAGETLTGVEVQSEKYSVGMPPALPAHRRPLPFLYESTGIETRFTNGLDPEPRSRNLFCFHRPETLAAWLGIDPSVGAAPDGLHMVAEPGVTWTPSTFLARMQHLPPIAAGSLWRVQLEAVRALEKSLAEGRRRALIQMATGSGKTFTAITATYRLLRYGGAKRVLFLVDRNNLGRQAKKEFDAYTLPDDGRKFTEVYNVQHMTANRVDDAARVCICTIQRLFAMLQGKEDVDEAAEEGSLFDSAMDVFKQPVPVSYNPKVPVETFDIVFTDECHRSIYNQWRQVLEYFDASLIGLTATPSAQTLGFFERNLVMEYNHQQAVADGVNVDFGVYRIRTAVTGQGGQVPAGEVVDRRDRRTRKVRWEALTDDLQYSGKDLDRAVVVPDQIRTVIRTFKDKVCTEIFPGRTEVPKTLIFAKDDSHADDIVKIVREEFGRGNDFAQKITYTSHIARIVDPVTGETTGYKSSGVKPEDLLQAFRNAYFPRIVVSVDMIATGTDVKPLEIVMFMRAVKSRTYFEQMVGRGVRVVSPAELQAVNPQGVTVKDHFMVVDCVGLAEEDLVDNKPLDRQPSVPLDKLLQAVSLHDNREEVVSTLANRLVRLDRQLTDTERNAVQNLAGGLSLHDMVQNIVHALNPDTQEAAATTLAGGAEPTEAQVTAAAGGLLANAVAPLADNPALRQLLLTLRQQHEQTIDRVTADTLLEAGVDGKAREQMQQMVHDFQTFLKEHVHDITALQVLYSRPYQQRLRRADVKALAEALQAPPRSWTPERLWQAYAAVDRGKVRGSAKSFSDIVALVQYALQQEAELRPYPENVEQRYQRWLDQQAGNGARFTAEQRWWLDAIKDQIAANLEMTIDDFEETPFGAQGGAVRAYQAFGGKLREVVEELNKVLVA